MHHIFVFASFAASLFLPATAAPVSSRNVSAPNGGDVSILNYALTLEFLERRFYTEGLQNFTAQDFQNAGFSPDFYEQMKTVLKDEQTHVDFLAGALGPKAIQEPTFSFPVKDVHSFIGLSSVLEGVGTSAYLGAAPAIADKNILTAAGSILAVEARHSSYIRAALGQKPIPNPFDTPLGFNQVFSLAAQFVTGFAPGTNLPFKAFPPLTATNPTASPTYHASQGNVVLTNAFQNAKSAGSVTENTKVFAVFFSGLQTYHVPATRSGNDYTAPIPGASFSKAGQPAPAGQVYLVLSTADGSENNTVTDENTISGVAILEVDN
ncbi:unnamed protein product [Clonostachys rosea f. rosea IK726]|uniref:Uncharacterized protein n=2 Tax=Bionectria ochroleuca TaxID=29856 RepID=A0A0B7JW42_BIOOC|nr:unnamed protein product [Clonostachys rosea f. rosea IK726]